MQVTTSPGNAHRPMRHPAQLVIHLEQQPPRTVILDRPTFTIGRDHGNDISIEHASVSRRHARLEQQGDVWYYHDLGSSNGSFINRQRVQKQALQDGDQIYFGDPSMGIRVYLTYQAPRQPVALSPDAQATIVSGSDPAAVGTMVVGGAPGAPPAPPAPAPASGTPSAHVTIQAPGQSPYDVVLDRMAFTVGRGTDNDIVLPQPASRHHGRLERHGTRWRYRDLGSTNGTFVNEQRVTEAELEDGDILRVGDPQGNWVRLTFHDPVAARAGRPAGQDRTIVIGGAQPGGTTSLSIGRNPASDIPLQAPNISWQHARLDQTAQGSVLVDLNSTNGTFVNGQRISTPHLLRKDDVIQIGPFRLVFDGLALQQYDQRRGGMRIDVRNMTLQLSNGRKLLNDVSLTIAPREFVALVGGSGAGKSTLMKAISGFNRATHGNPSPVQVNGDDYYKNFDSYRAVLGYVPQDDILHKPLPVDRALQYTANLRLPADTSTSEINERINRSLEIVEMSKHIKTMIESLSGGQRKRVSIASEMLADPSLFFLDEPTSGLDPGLEKKMMYTLRRLADSGRTVLLVTHATDNITQCDHVVFMEMGNLVYFGPPNEALDFFGVNSGSFADIYTHLKAEPGDELYQQLVQNTLRAEYYEWQTMNPGQNKPPPLVDLWKAHYHRSEQYRRYVVERQQSQHAMPMVKQTQGVDAPAKRPPRMSPWRQFYILTRRYLDLMLRDRRNLTILLVQSPLIALLVWMMAASDALVGSMQADVIQRISAQNLLFVFAVVGIWFGVINSASELTKEREIYRRERLSNLSIFPYIMSKVCVLSSLMFVQNASLLLIVWMFGAGVEFPRGDGLLLPIWLEMFITLMLASLGGMSMGLVVSAATKNVSQAISLVPLILIPQILFTGIIFKIEEGVINVISRLMVSRWALDAFGTSAALSSLCQLPNVLEGEVVKTQCEINESLRGETITMSSALLRTYIDDPQGFPFPGAFTHTAEHLLTAWGVLLAFLVVGLGITAFLLKQQDRQV